MTIQETAGSGKDIGGVAPLPEGWAEVPLASLGAWSSGATPSKSNHSYWSGTIPWVSPKDLKTDFISDSIDHVSESAIAAANLKILPAGTLLFVVRGMILARAFPVALTRVPVTVNQDIRALTPHAGIDPAFLFRALQHQASSILHAVKEATHGTLRLDSDDLKRWPLRLPPLAEQRRIVEKVELLVGLHGAARGRLRRAAQYLVSARHEMISAGVSGRLSANFRGSKNLAITWKRVALRDIGAWHTGGTPSRKKAEFFNGDIPWVKSGDLTNDVVSSIEERITKAGLENSAAKLLPVGSVLVALYGATIGKVGILAMPAATNQACAACVPNTKRIDPKFLMYFLLAQRSAFIEAGQGGAQPNISNEIVRGWPCRLPPVHEQREIVSRIDGLLSVMSDVERRVGAALAVSNSLPQSILAKAFAGELVPTDVELARIHGRRRSRPRSSDCAV